MIATEGIRSGRDALGAALTEVVGADHVLLQAARRAPYEVDWTGRYAGCALAVVLPATAQEVADVLGVCAGAGVPVVPQGGNSGLVGGGVPRGDEVLLSLRRLDWIEPVDAAAEQVTVGAGVTLASLQHVAGDLGLEFPLDMASRDQATIGGMVATNAAGARAWRHGPMRSQITGLEIVLSNGHVLSQFGGVSRSTTGYDWPTLILGSEGTLGIVTRARVRLIPRVATKVTALLGLATIDHAVDLAVSLRAELAELQVIEVLTESGISLVIERFNLARPLERPHAYYLLVETAGANAGTELGVVLDRSGVVGEAQLAEGAGEQRDLWQFRELLPRAVAGDPAPCKLDVVVPLPQVASAVSALPSAVAEVVPGAAVHIFGHLLDGNLHVNVLTPARDDAEAVTAAVLDVVRELGGAVGAEHGIGVSKRTWLHLSRSEAEIELFRSIKHSFDPIDLLNPGVLLP